MVMESRPACDDNEDTEATTSDDEKHDWVPYPPGHRKRAGFLRNYLTCVSQRELFSQTVWSPSVAFALRSHAFGDGTRRAETLQYDITKHPILKDFVDVLGETETLSSLHLRWPGFDDRKQTRVEDKRLLLQPLTHDSHARNTFQETYDTLVREVVIPAVVKAQQYAVDATALPIKQVYYASFPCVRVQQPSDFHTIRVHCDSMYGHGPCSVNCWLPLTELEQSGVNSLFVESFPGAKDFTPILCEVGELTLFDGARCAHFTVANTSDKTRVSLDFRVVLEPLFTYESHKDLGISDQSDESRQYHVGGYFSSAELCEESKKWKQVTQGAPCVKHGFPHENKEVVEQDGVD